MNVLKGILGTLVAGALILVAVSTIVYTIALTILILGVN
jgi:hypothetical protein